MRGELREGATDRPAKIMGEILRTSIGGWAGVKDPKTGKPVPFDGPASIGQIPILEQNLLAAYIYAEVFGGEKEDDQGKPSGRSPEPRPSSGPGGGASGTVTPATSSEKRAAKSP